MLPPFLWEWEKVRLHTTFDTANPRQSSTKKQILFNSTKTKAETIIPKGQLNSE